MDVSMMIYTLPEVKITWRHNDRAGEILLDMTHCVYSIPAFVLHVHWCLSKDTREDTTLERTQILDSKYCVNACDDPYHQMTPVMAEAVSLIAETDSLYYV